jgi:hypothetical protein
MEWLVALLIPIGICVVLPILTIWLIARCVMHRNEKKAALMMAAIERNAELNIGDLQFGNAKSPAERLLTKLMCGLMLLFAGAAVMMSLIFLPYIDFASDVVILIIMSGAVLSALGIALIVTYFVGRKLLNK